MLHTNFQGHWPFGSKEEDFLRFLPYMDMAAILVMWHRPFQQSFIPLSHGGFIRNLASIGLKVSKKRSLKMWIRVTLDEGQWMTLTFDIHIGSSTDLVNYIYQLWHIHYNSFWKIHCFTFFPCKSIRNQIWPCRIISQGQLRVIIWANLVVLEHPMLHTKF